MKGVNAMYTFNLYMKKKGLCGRLLWTCDADTWEQAISTFKQDGFVGSLRMKQLNENGDQLRVDDIRIR